MTSVPRLVVTLAALSALATLLVLGLSACKRPCQTPDNCVRSCSCLDNATNARSECPMSFRCDGEAQVCEDAYDSMSCDELCATYAARNRCNSVRCDADVECSKTLACNLVDANNNPIGSFQCDLLFACDQEIHACDPAFTLPDAQLCATPALCPPPAGS